MSTISKLSVMLSLNSGAYLQGLRTAKTASTSFGASIASVGSAVAGLAAPLAAATIAGAAGMALLTKRSFSAMDSTAKLSDRLGVTIGDLLGLRHAAELAGVGSGELDASLSQFVRRLGEAKMGTGEAVAGLHKLGLSAETLSQMSVGDAVGTIADRLNAFGSAADRSAIAAKLFGDQGQALLNTMAGGSAGLKAAREEVEKLGGAYSRVDAAKVEAANDAITRMKLAFGGVGNTLATAVAPIVESIAAKITGGVASANAGINSVSGMLSTFTAGVSVAIDNMGLTWKIGWKSIQYGASVAFDEVTFQVLRAWEVAKGVAPQLGGLFATAFENIKTIAMNVWDGIMSGKLFSQYFTIFKTYWSNAFIVLKNFGKSASLIAAGYWKALTTGDTTALSDSFTLALERGLTQGTTDMRGMVGDFIGTLTKGTKDFDFKLPVSNLTRTTSEVTQGLRDDLDALTAEFGDKLDAKMSVIATAKVLTTLPEDAQEAADILSGKGRALGMLETVGAGSVPQSMTAMAMMPQSVGFQGDADSLVMSDAVDVLKRIEKVLGKGMPTTAV
jgi:hypothetical protein